MSLHAQFVRQVKDHLESKEITQQELAHRMGRSEAWVSRILNERRNTTVQTIELVVRSLSMKLELKIDSTQE